MPWMGINDNGAHPIIRKILMIMFGISYEYTNLFSTCTSIKYAWTGVSATSDEHCCRMKESVADTAACTWKYSYNYWLLCGFIFWWPWIHQVGAGGPPVFLVHGVHEASACRCIYCSVKDTVNKLTKHLIHWELGTCIRSMYLWRCSVTCKHPKASDQQKQWQYWFIAVAFHWSCRHSCIACSVI